MSLTKLKASVEILIDFSEGRGNCPETQTAATAWVFCPPDRNSESLPCAVQRSENNFFKLTAVSIYTHPWGSASLDNLPLLNKPMLMPSY